MKAYTAEYIDGVLVTKPYTPDFKKQSFRYITTPEIIKDIKLLFVDKGAAYLARKYGTSENTIRINFKKAVGL